MASDRTGLLIIRAWIEEGSSEPLRAQVRCTSDVTGELGDELVLARTDAVCAAVREWLDDFMNDAES